MAKLGATVLTKFDESVTHIVTGVPRRTKKFLCAFVYTTFSASRWLVFCGSGNRKMQKRVSCLVFFHWDRSPGTKKSTTVAVRFVVSDFWKVSKTGLWRSEKSQVDSSCWKLSFCRDMRKMAPVTESMSDIEKITPSYHNKTPFASPPQRDCLCHQSPSLKRPIFYDARNFWRQNHHYQKCHIFDNIIFFSPKYKTFCWCFPK